MLLFRFSDHTPSEWERVAQEKLSGPSLADWESGLYSFIAEWFSANPFVEVKTSGSTGEPKTIRVSKKMMLVSARKTLRFFDLHPGDTALLCLSAHYIAGKMMVVRAITGNLLLYATEPSHNPLTGINRGFKFSAMVPSQVFEQIKEPGSLNRIEKLLIGGGAVSPTLELALSSYTGEAYESYGMTETVSHIALRRIIGNEKQAGFIPLENVTVSADNRGCIVITSADLLPHPVITNDVPVFLPEGQFRITGRIDNVINSGGIKIHPEEVERKLSSILHGMFVISSIPDEKLGEKVVLVSEKELTSEQQVRISEILSSYERPKEYIVISEIPLNKNHKTDRIKINQEIRLLKFRQ